MRTIYFIWHLSNRYVFDFGSPLTLTTIDFQLSNLYTKPTFTHLHVRFFFFIFRIQGLVIAGLGDLSRPANQLSIGQSASLFATGCIWSRYSLVIIPKNWGLFSVNVFVALTQLIQLTRAYNYSAIEEATAAAAEKQPETAKKA